MAEDLRKDSAFPIKKVNKRKLGADKETMAIAYLEAKGFRILTRNFRCRQGEIDVIARHGEYLVFVEVKYRKDAEKGSPQAAVGIQKQKKICRVADYYRLTREMGDGVAVRYDVIAIQGNEITWIPNAFPHCY